MAIPVVLVQQYQPTSLLLVLSEIIRFLEPVVNETIKKISSQVRRNLSPESGQFGRALSTNCVVQDL